MEVNISEMRMVDRDGEPIEDEEVSLREEYCKRICTECPCTLPYEYEYYDYDKCDMARAYAEERLRGKYMGENPLDTLRDDYLAGRCDILYRQWIPNAKKWSGWRSYRKTVKSSGANVPWPWDYPVATLYKRKDL